VRLQPLQTTDVPAGKVITLDPVGDLVAGQVVTLTHAVAPPAPSAAPADDGAAEAALGSAGAGSGETAIGDADAGDETAGNRGRGKRGGAKGRDKEDDQGNG